MRRVLIILIVVFSITTISAQKTDVEKKGFKGKVESVTVISCDYVDRFGEYIKENCRTFSIIKYDSDGNAIEMKTYIGEALIPNFITESIFEYYD